MSTTKTAYIWGPMSSFNGSLAAHLMIKGWHVHFACKSSLNFLSLSPLDLSSHAQQTLEAALGGKEMAKTFQDRYKFVEPGEGLKAFKYDAIIFGALPPNFDEARVPRAPWSAADFRNLGKHCKGVSTFIISSLWGGVQKDNVIPEELEFARRKPSTAWEATCQQYEQRILESLTGFEAPWYLVRLPILSGDTRSGDLLKPSGLNGLFKALVDQIGKPTFASGNTPVKLAYNPDCSLPFLPIDVAVSTFTNFLEDSGRPRVFNLLSTQMTLNREWLHDLAGALGVHDIVPDEHDGLDLPATLRRLLIEPVQVKTRSLFEVAGRYKIQPTPIDKDYFERLLQSARKINFGAQSAKMDAPGQQGQSCGTRGTACGEQIQYTEQIAHFYFEKWLPEKIAQGALKNARLNTLKVGFHLRSGSIYGWMIKVDEDGNPTVSRLDPTTTAQTDEKPDITFNFSGMALTRLIQHKMLLHRALLMREIDVEGNMLQVLKLSGTIDKFLRDNPLSARDIPQEYL